MLTGQVQSEKKRKVPEVLDNDSDWVDVGAIKRACKESWDLKNKTAQDNWSKSKRGKRLANNKEDLAKAEAGKAYVKTELLPKLKRRKNKRYVKLANHAMWNLTHEAKKRQQLVNKLESKKVSDPAVNVMYRVLDDCGLELTDNENDGVREDHIPDSSDCESSDEEVVMKDSDLDWYGFDMTAL